MRQHAEERTKRHKAMSCLQNCVSDVIFTRIMACETPKQAWDKLKEEFQCTERTRQIRLLGEQFSEARIMEKHCKKKGHVEKVCKNKGRPRQAQNQQPKAEAQVAEEGSDHEEHVFAVSCSVAKEKSSRGCLLNSGCTNHMSPDATIFKTLDRSCQTKFKVGNSQFIKAEGKGDVLICTSTSNKLISNVLLVPKIGRNLLTIAQLLNKGYSVVFKVNWPSGSNSAYTGSTDDFKLWHQRLGHANFRAMAKMISEDLVENFTKLVKHEDVYEKLEVAQMFLKFKAQAESETGCKLKTIRPDNGTEYTSAQFQAHYKNAGIKHQLTNVYTPQ
ncbi:golgin subfamily A member 3-like [Gossypium australe]|uniref:Golgin subfamily A member 3-like n=1 Tax=Gossypium australe TaxID=47621 RepID=A0A5B6VEJ1_9ROSI|nr:golgin subfamily A member 3-like [Gossypium australe]